MSILLPSDVAGESIAAPPEAALTLTGVSALQQTGFLSSLAVAGFRRVELGGGEGDLGNPTRMVGLALTELQKSLRDGGIETSSLLSTAGVGSSLAPRRQGARDAILRSIDLAHSLECPLVVVGGEVGPGSAADAAHYALDTLHDVDTALGRSGVKLAVRGCGPGSLLASGEARSILLGEAPDSVGLSLADRDLASEGVSADTAGTLAGRTLRAGIGANQVKARGLMLSDEASARDLLGRLGGNGFSGTLAVTPTLEHVDREELRRLYESLLTFVPSAFFSA
ncbi:MAG: TIM barrel protein [Planctomycetota bacterium]|jgi:hypothetical protein